MNTLSVSLAVYAPIGKLSCRLELMRDLLLPQVVRPAPLEQGPGVARLIWRVHTLSVPPEAVAEVMNEHGDTRREPLLGVCVEIFELSSRDGRFRNYLAVPALIGAGGPIQDEGRVVTVREPAGWGYYAEVADENPDVLLRRVLAGELYVDGEGIDDDEAADTLDPDDEDCSPDVDELVRAAGASFDQGE
ncbi:hypothetical protein [Paraburkholderia sp. CNPSo 3281]|uniref:hypothetical protein n=1 Tax=Paraburkholderia sp. CNPSo 3281 TaxID=2940933 RepID=UPI0020B65ADD|nr:hypothetical protein [Paraburkholderia sp. CNPSo 3281]MCP3714891.1 hypothetical protein [Paraburkholderia sp. CNPSo 3281]